MENAKTIRATDEVMKRFRDLAKASGMTQGEALSAMMSVYELATGTQAYPAVEDDVKNFQRAVNLILQLYSSAVKAGQTQRELAVAEVKRNLDSKDRTIQDLQDQLANCKEALKHNVDLETQLSDAKNRLGSVMDELNSLRVVFHSMPDAAVVKAQEKTIADLKQQVAVLTSQVTEKANTIEILASLKQIPTNESASVL